ncbi:MAG: phosphoribosylglycinamide formyltransferase [Bacteroidota bacterium]
MKTIVVFASGSGSNFQAVLDAAERGDIPARIVGLVAQREGIGAIDRAHRHGVPVSVLNPARFPDRSLFEKALMEQLDSWSPDLIVLAGYLVKVPSAVIARWNGKIINIHPSLLPDFGGKGFYGSRVHEAVLADGRTESGCTVHLVTEEFDKGPILGQRRVPVQPDDTPETLAARVLKEEHQLLPDVIRKLLTS